MALRERVEAAAREMFHGGEPSDFRRFAMRAGAEMATEYRAFCRALDSVVRELRRRTSAPDGQEGQGSGASFVPNTFQADILRALDGRALKKQQLADEVCGSEGSRLYRAGGIKELKARGLVENKPRLGYFRPDRPPTEA